MLKNVCRNDIDATTLIDQAVQKSGGRPSKTVSNRHSLDRPAGTTRDRALRQLRPSPDLHAQVVAELLAHAPMIEAGFRPRTFSVPDNIDAAAETLKRHFDDRLSALFCAIRDQINELT
jgi:hypothetical protein